MMSDRPFTEEDMKNDGLFKSELQGTMRQVASRENSEIYQLFTVVCDGVAPPEVKLADAAIRALNDDAFSERLEGVEVEVRSVKRAMNREEDLEYVQNLFERFGLGNNNSDLEDMLMDQIKKEIAGETSSPFEEIVNRIDGSEADNVLSSRLDEIERKLDMATVEQSEEEEAEEAVHKTMEERESEIDMLFEEDEPEEQGTDVEEHDETVEVPEETESDDVEQSDADTDEGEDVFGFDLGQTDSEEESVEFDDFEVDEMETSEYTVGEEEDVESDGFDDPDFTDDDDFDEGDE